MTSREPCRITPPEGLVVLVPVKDLTQAKTRLSSLLTLSERRHLAWMLLENVLMELTRLPEGVRRAVVSSYAPAIALAQSLGFGILREDHQISESHSVDQASARLEGEGAAAVLRLPLDLPLFTCEALEPVLREAAAGRQVVLVPSRDGTGTNALYRSPPTLFPSRFGPDSLSLHEHAARSRSGAVSVLRLPALGLDIDDPSDAAEVLRVAGACPASVYLREIGVPGRLSAPAFAGRPETA